MDPVFTTQIYNHFEGGKLAPMLISIEAASPRGSERQWSIILSQSNEEKTVGRLFTIGRRSGIIQTAAILDREPRSMSLPGGCLCHRKVLCLSPEHREQR